MSVIQLADYRPRRFSGSIENFSMNVTDNGLVLCVNIENENMQFFRILQNRDAHDLSQMLLNTMIAKMPICIDATFMNAEMYEINDIGFYEQD